MLRVFNMGLGMVLVCAPSDVKVVREPMPESRLVGRVVPQSGDQRVVLS
jgi:phosphoribosylaminoimidazole (AIR) synthetase